jgi:hypothetical protein
MDPWVVVVASPDSDSKTTKTPAVSEEGERERIGRNPISPRSPEPVSDKPTDLVVPPSTEDQEIGAGLKSSCLDLDRNTFEDHFIPPPESQGTGGDDEQFKKLPDTDLYLASLGKY